MKNAQERAKAVVDSVKDQFPKVWLGGRQQAVLQQVIALAMAQVEAETYEKAWSYVDILDRSQTSDTETIEMALSHFLEQAQRAKEEKR